MLFKALRPPDMNLKQLYLDRAARFEEEAKNLKAKYIRFSVVRLLLFVAAIGAIIYLFTISPIAAVVFIVVFLVAFAKFVKWHMNIQTQQQHNNNLNKINLYEKAALENDYSNFADGKVFQDVAHPYSIDLDIFGPYSFFQYCNRTATAIGRACLAKYLSAPAEKSEILLRQAATLELKEKLDWRQNLMALGMVAEDEIEHVNLLKDWLEDEPFVSNNSLYKIAILLTPFWVMFGIVATVLWIPWQLGILCLLIPGYFLKTTLEKVNETHLRTTHAEKMLALYGRLIGHIEKEDFKTEKLRSLQTVFTKDNQVASASINRLSYIISQLNLRYNAFAILINLFMLWDLRWIKRLEIWKAELKDKLPDWFESLQEFEALVSLATTNYNNPDWTMPIIQDDEKFVGLELGHPLIMADTRICNDLQMPTEGHLKLVTGSNMAGKSTFLRTMGLNIVLAMAGSAVCAKRLELPILQVHTSMRTQDALHESTSSFYAELKRLKTIIEAVESEQNIYFLLDEILKGTNSNDRHTGSKALIKQFIESRGAGIIATHDLELGQLEAQYGGAVENLCMEVRVKHDELVFNYKLEKGVSQSFNATHLMRNMGIKV